MIKEDAVYNVGTVYYSIDQTLDKSIILANSVKWKGKIGMIDVTEFVRATTNLTCATIYDYYTNVNCYNVESNYLANDVYWTISPMNNYDLYVVYYESKLYHSIDTSRNYNIRPVVTLKPDVKITGGDGSQNNAYNLEI